MRGALPFVALLAACGGAQPTDDDDTDLVVLDTFDTSATETVDTRPTFTEDDTGAFFVLEMRGNAIAQRGARFTGHQTVSAHWYRPADGTVGVPRCMYAIDLIDWARDPDRAGLDNPVGPDDYARCPNCAFTFTVTAKNTRQVERYPWNLPTDTDVDTDVPPDVGGYMPGGRTLNCRSLQRDQGFPTPEEIEDRDPTMPNPQFPEWRGIGFDPVVDGDPDNLRTGLIMVWSPRDAAWSATYAATWDGTILEWQEILLPAYEYAP